MNESTDSQRQALARSQEPLPGHRIVMSTLDHLRITGLLVQSEANRMPCIGLLEKKLQQAAVAVPKAMPSDVVTMNSPLLFLEMDCRAVYGFTLVYPKPEKREGDVSYSPRLEPRCWDHPLDRKFAG